MLLQIIEFTFAITGTLLLMAVYFLLAWIPFNYWTSKSGRKKTNECA